MLRSKCISDAVIPPYYVYYSHRVQINTAQAKRDNFKLIYAFLPCTLRKTQDA